MSSEGSYYSDEEYWEDEYWEDGYGSASGSERSSSSQQSGLESDESDGEGKGNDRRCHDSSQEEPEQQEQQEPLFESTSQSPTSKGRSSRPPPIPPAPPRDAWTGNGAVKALKTDDMSPRSLLGSIPEHWWKNPEDVEAEVMNSIPASIDSQDAAEWYSSHEDHWRAVLEIVSGKLDATITDARDDMMAAMSSVTAVGDDLESAIILLRNTRRCLRQSDTALNTKSLAVTQLAQRRATIISVQNLVKAMASLIATEKEVEALVQAGDFPQALDVAAAASASKRKLRKIRAVRGVAGRVKRIHESIWTALFRATVGCCIALEKDKYEKILGAFDDPETRTRAVAGLLPAAFNEALLRSSTLIVTSRELGQMNRAAALELDLESLPGFVLLCKDLAEEEFRDVVRAVLACFVDIMANHALLVDFHSGSNEEVGWAGLLECLAEVKPDMWEEMQRLLAILIGSGSVLELDVNSFLELYQALATFTDLATNWAGVSKSTTLGASLKSVAKAYFDGFHRSTLAALRETLSQESWYPTQEAGADFCPASVGEFASFLSSPLGLGSSTGKQERRPGPETDTGDRDSVPTASLSRESDSAGPPAPPTPTLLSPPESTATSPSERSQGSANTALSSPTIRTMLTTAEAGDVPKPAVSFLGGAANPFRVPDTPFTPKSDPNASSKLDPIELMVEARKDAGDVSAQSRDIARHERVSNTAVMLVELIGEYLHMLNTLPNIRAQVWVALTHLVDMVVYCSWSFFPADPANRGDASGLGELSESLRSLITRLHSQHKPAPAPSTFSMLLSPTSPVEEEEQSIAQTLAAPEPVAELEVGEEGHAYGVVERLVAAESLMFIMDALQAVRAPVDRLVEGQTQFLFEQYFTHTVSVLPSLRRELFRVAAVAALPWEHLPHAISAVKWDTQDMITTAHPWATTSLEAIREWSKDVSPLIGPELESSISERAGVALWTEVVDGLTAAVIEGFALVKKCSAEGRANMAVDVKTLQMGIQAIAPLRPLPGFPKVSAYIQAFYLTETDIRDWILKHREFSAAQLIAVVSVGVGTTMKRKARGELISWIGSLYGEEGSAAAARSRTLSGASAGPKVKKLVDAMTFLGSLKGGGNSA